MQWHDDVPGHDGLITGARLLGKDMGQVILERESYAVDYQGYKLWNIGRSIVRPSGNQLQVLNIGSTGDDGILSEIEQAESWSVDLGPVDPLGIAAPGSALYVSAIGQVNGVAEQPLGTFAVTKAGGLFDIIADFGPIGSSTQTAVVRDNGTVVASVSGHIGPVVTASSWPIGLGRLGEPGADGYSSRHSPLTQFVVGGVSYIGDELQIIAESPSGVTDFNSELEIRASGIGQFTVASMQVVPAASTTLITTFDGGNGLGAGATTFFDLDAAFPVTIKALDVHVDTLGGAGTIEIYSFPVTAFGNEGMGVGPWTLVGDGTYISNGPGAPTPVSLRSPIALSTGSTGIAICYLGTGVNYTNGAGATPTDVFMGVGLTMTAGTASPTCLNALNIFSSRIANIAITYSVPAGVATEGKYGESCGEGFASLYELFDGATSTFDLGGAPAAENVISAQFTGPGYAFTQGASAFFTPTSVALALTDDSVSAQVMPFPMALPDGTMTNDITISSNGFVWLNGTNTVNDFSESVAELLSGDPRIAVLWDDLNVADATAPGAIHFDVDPSGNAVYVTYLNVVEFGAAGAANGPNTAQLMIDNQGNFELRYGTVGSLDSLVGFSLGGGAADPGAEDLSAVSVVLTQADAPSMVLCADARPISGTTINLVTEGIPATALAGATILSFGQILPGAPTSFVGCELYVGAGSSLFFVPAGSTTNSLPLPIPNDPTLSGVMVYAQSAVLTSVDPLDGLTSNGVELVVGMN